MLNEIVIIFPLYELMSYTNIYQYKIHFVIINK
ncbi:hypothetical protein [Salmonella phage SD-15_S21]|nr:hypothetical protein [Salmonella phage SD-15_S21]